MTGIAKLIPDTVNGKGAISFFNHISLVGRGILVNRLVRIRDKKPLSALLVIEHSVYGLVYRIGFVHQYLGELAASFETTCIDVGNSCRNEYVGETGAPLKTS